MCSRKNDLSPDDEDGDGESVSADDDEDGEGGGGGGSDNYRDDNGVDDDLRKSSSSSSGGSKVTVNPAPLAMWPGWTQSPGREFIALRRAQWSLNNRLPNEFRLYTLLLFQVFERVRPCSCVCRCVRRVRTRSPAVGSNLFKRFFLFPSLFPLAPAPAPSH